MGCSAHAEIDPRPVLRLRCGTGLLRARGDRPPAATSAARKVSAAPRTRRSTSTHRANVSIASGCSAHAEIDPWSRATGRTSWGLLRARGDRPLHQSPLTRPIVAAPRTRRSTRAADRERQRAHGCSAHAEIDPARRCSCRCAGRLLRARGDRPVAIPRQTGAATAAPRTRRSTRPVLGPDGPCGGCSAHAEIDPARTVSAPSRFGLLRARGDRPAGSGSGGKTISAAPRTRRSTLGDERRCSRFDGCSAHAEIDPPRLRSRSTRRRLLRARGDRPLRGYWPLHGRAAAPRTRRSTARDPDGRAAAAADGGCSAHAEIDPNPHHGWGWSARLLRARGDRPGSESASSRQWWVAPRTRRSTLRRPTAGDRRRGCSAHAEIDPRHRCRPAPRTGLLRARGDRPVLSGNIGGAFRAAPRTRRSTLHRRRHHEPAHGCSAHAEIDLDTSARSVDAGGLLRARGDRPLKAASFFLTVAAAPRTRRSTL